MTPRLRNIENVSPICPTLMVHRTRYAVLLWAITREREAWSDRLRRRTSTSSYKTHHFYLIRALRSRPHLTLQELIRKQSTTNRRWKSESAGGAKNAVLYIKLPRTSGRAPRAPKDPYSKQHTTSHHR